jgi:hypothetical protein
MVVNVSFIPKVNEMIVGCKNYFGESEEWHLWGVLDVMGSCGGVGFGESLPAVIVNETSH